MAYSYNEITSVPLEISLGYILRNTSSLLQFFTDQIVSGSGIVEIDNMVEESTVSEINYLQPSTYKLDSGYNFYTDYFEDLTTKTAGIQESGLPNLYIYGDDLNKNTPKYETIVTVKDTVQIGVSAQNNLFEYFDNYAADYERSVRTQNSQTPLFNEVANLEKNIYYTKQGVQRFKEINKNQFLMPYGNKINFRTNEVSQFSAILEGANFIDSFCKSMINFSSNKAFPNIQLNFLLQDSFLESERVTTSQKIVTETVRGKAFNNTQEFLNLIKNLIINETDILSIGDKPTKSTTTLQPQGSSITTNTAAINNNQSSSISRAIRMAVFTKRISQFMKANKLSPKEFLTGESFFTEAFMYQLDKNNEDGSNVQSFYMPNITDIQELDLFDSQVKFGKKYSYSLKSFYFSLGQRINIQLLNNLTAEQWGRILTQAYQDNPTIEIIAQSILNNIILNDSESLLLTSLILQSIEKIGLDPFVYYPIIFKKEMFNDIIAVFDRPPPPPEIEVDGLMGIDDKIFLRLNSSISEFKAIPVLIQPEDREIFNRNVLVQKLDSLVEPMMFDGDDRPTHFQIFRLDYQPKSFSDFKDNFVTASTTTNCGVSTQNYQYCDLLKSNHSSYVDTIKSNQKYYYMFRTVDVHGNISNPSPIYEIEMINEDGTIFPLIKIVDLLKIEDKQPGKTVKRFLHIVPNAIQSLVNEQDSGYFDENGEIKDSADLIKDRVVLGLTEQKVWNKSYRLKVKSKTTGKVIEIDFKFTQKTLINPANCQ